jgi:hypothetical protein
MKHLFHLISADVRRFRLLLAVWLLIQIVDTIFRGVRPALAPEPRLQTAVELLAMVLFLTRWIGMIVIVPLVVQAHPLVGSDAFWMTRPIPWRALLGSKVVLLWTTIVAAPALCELALMLASRVPLAEIPFVTLQTILFHSLWLFIVMALSTTTRNLARFALVAGSVLVGFGLLINIVIAVMIRNLPDGPQLTAMTPRSVSSPTPGVVLLLLLIIAAVLQILLQYRMRSARASVSAGVGVVAVAVLISILWPWEARPLPVPEWVRQESALRLVAESQQSEFGPLEDRSTWSRSDGWQMGGVRLRLSGVEEGWLATVRLADSRLQFGDGTTLTSIGNGYSSLVPFAFVDDSPWRVVMRQVLGVGRVLEGPQGQGRLVGETVPAIVVRQADFKTHLGAAGTYRGRFLVDLDRVEVAGALPLQPGAEFQERRRRMVIEQVVPRGQFAFIRVRQFTAATMFDSASVPRVSFFLRNRDRGEAVAGTGGVGIVMSSALALPLLFGVSGHSAGTGTGFNLTSDLIRFPDHGADAQAVDISAAWLSRAELVLVHTVHAGSATRTIEVSGLEIAPAPPRLPR